MNECGCEWVARVGVNERVKKTGREREYEGEYECMSELFSMTSLWAGRLEDDWFLQCRPGDRFVRQCERREPVSPQ